MAASSSIPLAACGGNGSGPAPSDGLGDASATAVPPSSPQSERRADAAAARFLLRASFSASLRDVEAVRTEGTAAWLDRHIRQPNDQSAVQIAHELGLDRVNSDREFDHDLSFDRVIWSHLLNGGNSVRKRIAFALSQFFVVSVNRLNIIWPTIAVASYWDILNEGAFGNFRDLLEEVCLSPAMAAFLDTIGNRKEDNKTGRVPDENFAREVMQLFSIGLHELNIDGSSKSANGRPIETYTNDDVAGLAKVFTGYDLDAAQVARFVHPLRPNSRPPIAEVVLRRITADPSRWPKPSTVSQHSPSEKSFLGISIPAGTDPSESLKIALDTLFEHPNTGPFFCKQMIQRLVTSNPSPEYVRRVAQVFNDNGQGVRGDLSAIFKAILIDPEAESADGLNDMRFGKLREPLVRFVQFMRTFGHSATEGGGITRNLYAAGLLEQVPLRSPSVFHFSRPEYVAAGSVAQANDLVGPEFQLVNETSVANYVNFMWNNIRGGAYWLNDLQPDYSGFMEIAADPIALVDRLDLLLTAGQLRNATRDQILSAVEGVAIAGAEDQENLLKRIQIAITLIMVSNDYLVQK
jgi:uncharacterized protein (DUF1800 family)